MYKLYPKRIDRNTLLDYVSRHGFNKTAVKIKRLEPFVDIDCKGRMLLRLTGRKKAEYIIKKNGPSQN